MPQSHNFSLPPLVARTVAKIEDLMRAFPGHPLPARKRLSQKLDVSEGTIRRAFQVLSERGVLETGRGRVFRPIAPEPESSAPGGFGDAASVPPGDGGMGISSSRDSLFERLRMEITTGRLAEGGRLPQIQALQKELRVSNRTVSAAYGRLEHEGLVHRRGRAWFIGRVRPRIRRPESLSILVLLSKESGWRGLHAPRTEAFARTFEHEARLHGVRLMPALAMETPYWESVLVSGFAEIERQVETLGKNYLGTLIASPRAELPDLGRWSALLARRKHPVLWFDRYGLGTDGKVLPSEKEFIRVRFSEEAGISVALAALREAGHRDVAYLYRRGDWSEQRLHLLHQVNDRYAHGLRIHALGPRESMRPGMPWPRCSLPMDLQRLLPRKGRARWRDLVSGRMEEIGRNKVQKAMSREFHYLSLFTPHMMRLLEVPSVTALIASNDEEARHLYYWLRVFGFSVPRDFSLVSFDNSPALAPLPISSVDFGFGYLGYWSFHSILQDVRLPAHSPGDLPAQPFLFDRGSLGSPREIE